MAVNIPVPVHTHSKVPFCGFVRQFHWSSGTGDPESDGLQVIVTSAPHKGGRNGGEEGKGLGGRGEVYVEHTCIYKHPYKHTHSHTHVHTHTLTYRTTTYIDQMNAWYDKKTSQELVNLKLWEQLKDAVDVFGLSAVDRLFSFMIVQELQTFLKYLTRFLLRQGGPFLKVMAAFGQELSNPDRLIGEGCGMDEGVRMV